MTLINSLEVIMVFPSVSGLLLRWDELYHGQNNFPIEIFYAGQASVSFFLYGLGTRTLACWRVRWRAGAYAGVLARMRRIRRADVGLSYIAH